MENTELWNRARKLNLGKDFLSGLDELLTSLESDNKQLIITDVSQQRELLLAYEDYLNEYHTKEDRIKQVDKYLKANNCG